MADTAKKEISVEEFETIKAQLEQVSGERDQYRAAYEQAMEQNASVWGMYSSLIDYVATQTVRKQSK